MLRKQSRLQQNRGNQQNVQRSGRNPRDEIGPDFFRRRRRRNEVNFAGHENIWIDQLGVHDLRTDAWLRRRGTLRHRDALIHFRHLQRNGNVFDHRVCRAKNISRNYNARSDGIQRKIRRNI